MSRFDASTVKDGTHSKRNFQVVDISLRHDTDLVDSDSVDPYWGNAFCRNDDHITNEVDSEDGSLPAVHVFHDCAPSSLDSVETYDPFDEHEKSSKVHMSILLEEMYDRLYDPNILEREKAEALEKPNTSPTEEHKKNLIRRHNFETQNRPQASSQPPLMSEWTVMYPHFRVVGKHCVDGVVEKPKTQENTEDPFPNLLLLRRRKVVDGRLSPSREVQDVRWEENFSAQFGERVTSTNIPNAPERKHVARFNDQIPRRLGKKSQCNLYISPASISRPPNHNKVVEEEILAIDGVIDEPLVICEEENMSKFELREMELAIIRHGRAGIPAIEPSDAIREELVHHLLDILWAKMVPLFSPTFRRLVFFSCSSQKQLGSRTPGDKSDGPFRMHNNHEPPLFEERRCCEDNYIAQEVALRMINEAGTDCLLHDPAAPANSRRSEKTEDDLASLMQITSMETEVVTSRRKVWETRPRQKRSNDGNHYENSLMFTAGAFVGGSLMQGKMILRDDVRNTKEAVPNQIAGHNSSSQKVSFSGGGYKMRGHGRRPASFDAYRGHQRVQLPSLSGQTSLSLDGVCCDSNVVAGRVKSAGDEYRRPQFASASKKQPITLPQIRPCNRS